MINQNLTILYFVCVWWFLYQIQMSQHFNHIMTIVCYIFRPPISEQFLLAVNKTVSLSRLYRQTAQAHKYGDFSLVSHQFSHVYWKLSALNGKHKCININESELLLTSIGPLRKSYEYRTISCSSHNQLKLEYWVLALNWST